MWFAVSTKPRKESVAEKHIALKGVEVYLPKIEMGRRRGTRRVIMREPLFPGYLFVNSDDPLDLFMKVRWTHGVNRLLCAGRTPILVPDEAVNLIKWRIGQGGPEVPKVEREFSPGDMVAVRHGPFAGLLGVVDRAIPGKERVRVFLDFMARQTPVEMDNVLLDRLD
jgi:transcription elongation factor/antiterminator RfaH